jgi:hypothetical protein
VSNVVIVPNTVTFLGADATTRGNWQGVYGQDGNIIAQDTMGPPAYTIFNPVNVNLELYSLWSSDPRALLNPNSGYNTSERVMSWYHTGSSMDLQISASDGQSHRVALYFCDFDSQGRSLTLQVFNTSTGAIYDTRTVASYSGGIYLVYLYSGPVTFRVTNNNLVTPTASVTALFWGGTGIPAPDSTPPSVSLTSPAAGQVMGKVAVVANATDNVGVVSVQLLLDSQPLGGVLTATPYSLTWDTKTVSNGSHTLSAIASDAAGNSAAATPVAVTVNNPAPPSVSIATPSTGTVSGTVNITATASSAVGISSVQYRLDGFTLGSALTASPYLYPWNSQAATNGVHSLTALATDLLSNSTLSSAVAVTILNAVPPTGTFVNYLYTDTTTLGNWKGVYGQDGNYIVLNSYAVPSYSIFDPIGDNQLMTDAYATDPRALLKYLFSYSPTERVETQFYSRFYMDFQVNTSDNQAHTVALYFCDYINWGRSISVTAFDTATQAVLDTRQLTSYTSGVYLVYNYRGAVTFRVANNYQPLTTNPNATVSAFFWGSPTTIGN